MASSRGSHRIFRANISDFKILEQTHELTKRAAQLLKENPKPDTFIGRKTQEPFPAEDESRAEGE